MRLESASCPTAAADWPIAAQSEINHNRPIMKTADVELTDAGKSGRSLGSLFGLSDNKKAPKFKAGSHPSAGGAASEKTQISQSIADVVKLLRADAISKGGVHAD